MNRYVLAGLAYDLQTGKRVYVASSRRLHAERVVRNLADHLLEMGGSSFSASRERIRHESGGLLTVATASEDGFRGASPDVVVILDWYGLTDRAIDGLSRTLEIIQSVRPFELIRF